MDIVCKHCKEEGLRLSSIEDINEASMLKMVWSKRNGNLKRKMFLQLVCSGHLFR